jgi:hypothetical protein
MRWMGCAAPVKEFRKVYKILAEIMCGRGHFVELILHAKIILKMILKRTISACELNSSYSGRRKVEACCTLIGEIFVKKGADFVAI